MTDQPEFVNQAIGLETTLHPLALLAATQQIERMAGRQRSQHWGPRTLDIDILFYDDLVVHSRLLSIPHPQLPQRNFALIPLCEIAPDVIHPVLQLPIHTLLEHSTDQSEVAILADR